jgi:Zn-dependent peptidase ImmA (M78 family)
VSEEGDNMARRVKHIQTIVEQLLEQTNNTKPPIDVRRIIRNLNIILREERLEDISGLIFREGNQVIIGVNNEHAETRKRFTVAHELGHYYLHSNNPLFVDKVFAVELRDHLSSEAVSIEEIEANSFAAELLMPKKMLLNDLQKIQSGVMDYDNDEVMDKLIQSLAHVYDVSKQAMTIRLINLDVISKIINL